MRFCIEISITELWNLCSYNSRTSWCGRNIRKSSIIWNFYGWIILIFICKHERRHGSRSRFSMRSCDSNSLFCIKYFSKSYRIRNMPNMEISSLSEFWICVDLLFWWEIRLGNDCLRINNKIRIFSKIISIMSDVYLKSLIPESFEKR